MMYKLSLILLLVACSSLTDQDSEIMDDTLDDNTNSTVVVQDVEFSGNEGAYTFSVQLKSPDTGCEQYADWWEVIDLDGNLLYRRNLGHSHVNEQPFIRSGGPVPISAEQFIIVRGHMNNSGYGTDIMKGSVDNGLQMDTLSATFAISLENQAPLPPTCAF